MDLADLTRDLDALRDEALAAIAAARTPAALDAARVDVLGKKGAPDGACCAASAACRPRIGPGSARSPTLSGARSRPRSRSAVRRCRLGASTARLAAETVDVTTPGRPIRRGSLHPIIETIREIAEIFGQFGFVVYEGPEIEDDLTNFQMLNIPPDHPARDLWDTLYVDVDGPPAADPHVAGPDPGDAADAAADPGPAARPLLPLRGDRRQPRLRVLPGRGPDGRRGHDHGRPARACSTSSPMRCSAPDRATRFRPGYYPFTEPSVAFDVAVPRLRRRRAARPAPEPAG